MSERQSYFTATRHPLACLLFLLPLLIIYEFGVLRLGGDAPETIRNGADHWVRQAMSTLGAQQMLVLPLLLIGLLLVRSIRQRKSRPKDLIGVLMGMTIESVSFALVLWGISRALGPLLSAITMSAPPPQTLLITYVGAGIYEETVFRLIIFAGLVWFFRKADVPMWLGVSLAALVSATLFSAAHHVGPNGETFEGTIFIFRMVAGLYFAFIYQFRGFGIAVGAHACYDVAVGIVVSPGVS